MNYNRIRTIISKINRDCDQGDYGEARRMIEFNLKELQNSANYFSLNENSKIILKHVVSENEKDLPPLTRLELFQLKDINKYSSEFNVSMLKRTIKTALSILTRPDVEHLLTKDAKIVLSSLGVITTAKKSEKEILKEMA